MLRRYLLSAASAIAIAAPAFAADLPPPPPPVPIFTWTGVYIGGQIGYAWGNDNINITDFVVPAFFTLSSNPNGVIGGAHLGYNLQIGQWVAGLEGDVDGTNFRRTSGPDPIFGDTFFRIRKDIEGSVRGRAGIAWDRVLLYATGGVAFAGIDTSYTSPVGFDGFSRTRVGFTVGGGIEYAVTNNWSVRAEYRFSDFGRLTDLPAVALAPGIAVGHRLIQNRVQAGFSYKFDAWAPGPAVAAY
ncbi:MAG: porin family protein [Beijerinckiaceae bacterium]|nr:porin family protein [Beijerinckiaceae bacterium]MCI0734777.1 porin family protein [Beijerinckiaceae bacterium]